MQPRHVETLISNTDEVLRLVQIHEQISGTGPGRRREVEVLNKSGIVLLVATWEAFVEDLATAAFDRIFDTASTHTIFPQRVLNLAANELRSSPDVRRIWELAGTGWRAILADHKVKILEKFVGSLNTPKPEQIDGMFSELIGLTNLSACWRWKNTSSANARARLTALVELRGDIAHRVATSRSVKKPDVINSVHLISRLAAASSNHSRAFIYGLTNKHPWPPVHYHGMARHAVSAREVGVYHRICEEMGGQ